MRLLHTTSKNFNDELADFCRDAEVPQDIVDSVATILADVRVRGDMAVANYAAKFDGAKLRSREFHVSEKELAVAAESVSSDDLKAIRASHSNIVAYNRRSLPEPWEDRNKHGAMIGEKHDPIRRVGIYVPGGQVPLVSTVLMTASLAMIAGCPEIAVFTPSDNHGKVAPSLLAALHFLGIKEVYRIGGVHAVASMAYGTETIPAVDKVFGPGNAYVCEAKRQVFGTVGVDSLPGPSEVMVIADQTARVDFVAADILAQAEHGSGREKVYLVATSEKIAQAIHHEVEMQVSELSREEKTQNVLDQGFLTIVVENLNQAAEIANYVAPEHLELIVKEASLKKLIKTITTAGAIMIGNYTPTALGDFTAGPSHVLPTGRTGRFFSGLRVADFMRRTSIVRYDEKSVKAGNKVVATFAVMEKLDAHGRSVELRTNS